MSGLKQTVFSLCGLLGVDRLFAHLNRHRPVVLVFHGVTAEAPGHPCNREGMHLHTPIFEALMEFVAARHRPVALARIVDWLEGRGSLPERAVAVTFDDGYRNVLTQAAPILRRLSIPATLFVATDFVFGGRMLWNDRLNAALYLTRASRLTIALASGPMDFALASDGDRFAAERALLEVCKKLPDAERVALVDRVIGSLGVEETELRSAWSEFAAIAPGELPRLIQFGVDVGSHTCSHGIATRMGDDQVARELRESRRLLESASGRACEHFSYPNGGPSDHDARTRRHVVDAGYRCAVTTIKTAVQPHQDAFTIPRCTLTHNRVTVPEFSAHVSGLTEFARVLRGRRPEGGSWGSAGTS